MSIDKVLKVKDGRYIYNTEEVKRVIKNKNFDFDEFNKVNKTNYTLQSFTEQTLKNLNETKLMNLNTNKMMPPSKYWGWNLKTEKWNFIRDVRDYNNTKHAIHEFKNIIILLETGSGVAPALALLPGLGSTAVILSGVASSIGIGYFALTISSLEYKNNGSGTIHDINRFTAAFTIWSQSEFHGNIWR